MKTLFLITFFLIFSLSVKAESHTAVRRLVASQNGMIDEALRSVMENRCDRYISYFEIPDCKKAVRRMLKVLDYDVIVSQKSAQQAEAWEPSSFVFVAFKKDFLDLLGDPKTTAYLNDLNQELYRYLTHKKSHASVWDFTSSYFRTSFLAVRAIAVLFQDTGHTKLHLAYLERAGIDRGETFNTNKELLSRVIDTINLILNNSESRYRKLFYPADVEKYLNRNIYHYYVPNYLAQSLTLYGSSPTDAFRATLMLTLTYEFITSSKDIRNLYSDPANITLEHTIKDIYGGYAGSVHGTKGMKLNASYDEVKEMFTRSTADAVEMLLRQ